MRTAAFIRFLLAALLVCLSGCEAHGPTTSAFDGVIKAPAIRPILGFSVHRGWG